MEPVNTETERGDFKNIAIPAILIILLLAGLVVLSVGCGGPSPLPGAEQFEVVGAYGKPSRHYPIEDEMCMEWDEDGTWIRRSYFKMTSSQPASNRVRIGWVLRETILNWGHPFFRTPIGNE